MSITTITKIPKPSSHAHHHLLQCLFVFSPRLMGATEVTSFRCSTSWVFVSVGKVDIFSVYGSVVRVSISSPSPNGGYPGCIRCG